MVLKPDFFDVPMNFQLGRVNYMVLKRFVKSLDFRLQCWVWKKIKLHGTQTLTIKQGGDRVWKKIKLQGTQTEKIFI